MATILNYIVLTAAIYFARVDGAEKKLLSEKNPSRNGTTYIITSLMDEFALTVNKNGDVTSEKLTNAPEQKWTIVKHPSNPDALEFKQSVVPSNSLSGYADSAGKSIPREIVLASRGMVKDFPSWNIKTGRWCLQANGHSSTFDMDNCEDFEAPWQLWMLEEVS